MMNYLSGATLGLLVLALATGCGKPIGTASCHFGGTLVVHHPDGSITFADVEGNAPCDKF